ncbi:MAG: hypothetical protein J6D06_09325 [Clostridia bacterium]|nr:hypothetical protein [Clostridia bacterium]
MNKQKQREILDKTINGALRAFAASVKSGNEVLTSDSFVTDNFYIGTPAFLNECISNSKWSLGFADVVLTPVDYKKREYYMGGYMVPDNKFKNLVEDVVDNMMGRAVALDDGSDRGVSLFCTIDCIGIANSDIKEIRKLFKEKAERIYPDKKINSINIFSTHAHSCVDTQGLWTEFPSKLLRNLRRKYTGKGVLEKGADEQYMRFLYERVSEALMNALGNMVPGEMSFARKDITEDYFVNKNRPSATGIVTDITRLTFTPDDMNNTPTIIVNLPAHPDVAGLAVKGEKGSGRRLSGEYVYYMGEVINKAGYNFMFFNGAICAIYMSCDKSNDGLKLNHRYEMSVRFGREIGKITLSLTKTLDEIKKDNLLYDEQEIKKEAELAKRNGGKYTLWCENWEPVQEIKIDPILNIRLKQIKIPVKNNLMVAVGKLKLANFKVICEENQYYVWSEIGYIELGKQIKIAMVPGEFCCDLLVGGASLYAEGSVTHTDFGLPALGEIFGEDTIVFGLANDAVGYIVPDNDYTMGDPQHHYHELISLGCETGSSVMKGFVELSGLINENR